MSLRADSIEKYKMFGNLLEIRFRSKLPTINIKTRNNECSDFQYVEFLVLKISKAYLKSPISEYQKAILYFWCFHSMSVLTRYIANIVWRHFYLQFLEVLESLEEN